MASNTVPMVRHRLVVRHPSRDEILVDSGGLPCVVLQERHTAEVDYLNAAVAERLGLRTAVVRSLSYSEIDGAVDRAHELEALGGNAPAPSTLQWRSVAEIEAFDAVLDRQAFAQWLRERDAPPVDGRDWTRPGWLAGTRVWIEEALRRTGVSAATEVIQLRTWATSTVLLVRTPSGDYYFKALPESGRVEAALTAYLAEHFPSAVPRIIATEPARGWLLMEACGGRKLEESADVTVWEHAATRYARLQVDCIERVEELRSLGCPSRDLDALARSIAVLAADADAMRSEHPEGLTRAEVERFVAMVPALQLRCHELATCAIPASLEHGDLWPGNIFCDAASSAVIDWEDAVIAHPFFSLAPLTVGLMGSELGTAENVARLERAYLSAFESVADAVHLKRAVELAMPLCFFDMAARYHRQRPSIVRLHPWMRDLVPQTLRLAMSRLS